MNSPPNHKWEEGLDIDNSDLLLTPIFRPTNNPHIVPEITTTTQTLISAQNHQVYNYNEWEQALDIDNFDLRLTPVVRPSNNPHIVSEITTTIQTMISSQNHQVDNYDEWEEGLDIDVSDLRLTPIIHPSNNPHIDNTRSCWYCSKAKLCKLADTRESGEESVMSTQEYIIKFIEDVGEDDDFMRAPWLSVLDRVHVDGGIVVGCFGDVKKFLKNGKLEKVVAVIKSCTLNALGDLTVTLKDRYNL
ncbi:hypothetical protein Tco_1564858 [Tanacetum coccineum]